jgi:hypothetical protein
MTEGFGGRRRRLSARRQGPGHLLLRHADGGPGGDDDLRKALVGHVRHEIGPIASPDKIQFAPGLPKTRSGKIMRRILRKIAEDDFDARSALGDTELDARRSQTRSGCSGASLLSTPT